MFVFEDFSGPYFNIFGLEYGDLLGSNTEKCIQPEETLQNENFHAVISFYRKVKTVFLFRNFFVVYEILYVLESTFNNLTSLWSTLASPENLI